MIKKKYVGYIVVLSLIVIVYFVLSLAMSKTRRDHMEEYLKVTPSQYSVKEGDDFVTITFQGSMKDVLEYLHKLRFIKKNSSVDYYGLSPVEQGRFIEKATRQFESVSNYVVYSDHVDIKDAPPAILTIELKKKFNQYECELFYFEKVSQSSN